MIPIGPALPAPFLCAKSPTSTAVCHVRIMFSNFSSSSSRPLAAKRRKVTRACDYCREHRVRCEAAVPCPQCVANHVTCSRQSVPAAHTPSENIQRREQPRLGSLPSGPRAQKPDSMLGFIARINTFCSGVSQLSSSAIPGHTPPPEYISPVSPGVLQEATPLDCSLSESQVNRLLSIFWTRLWPLMPILRREDLSPAAPGFSSPLRDAVIAYSMQYVHSSRLHNCLLGLHGPQFQPDKQTPMIGLPYFQRCLRAVTLYSSFSQPSLLILQCHCFMALYLLDAGQHSTAYNIIGLALRITESLNWELDAQTASTVRGCRLFYRLWWTLNHLDFRCSRHLGKPIGVHLQDSVCPPPTRESDTLLDPGSTLYHTESIRLTAAALAIIESTGCVSISAQGRQETTEIETRAQVLSDEMRHLRKWRMDLPSTGSLGNLRLEVGDTPPDPDKEPEVEVDYMKHQPMEILLTTLLELQYYNVIITLHRSFIQFPSHPLIPKSSPKADAHSATALNHALAIIRLTHSRMATYDILQGVPEVYQYLWNAVLTLVGFMLAYPYCYRLPRARRYIRLALEIFDSAGSTNDAAIRSAALTRHLCSKVDTLLHILHIDPPPGPRQSSEGVHSERSREQGTSNIIPRTDHSIPEEELPAPSSFSDPSLDSLWSWVDLMNMEAWPNYCDEVNEAFMNPADFSI